MHCTGGCIIIINTVLVNFIIQKESCYWTVVPFVVFELFSVAHISVLKALIKNPTNFVHDLFKFTVAQISTSSQAIIHV